MKMIKIISFSMLALLSVIACKNQEVSLIIKGSDTVLPLTQKLAEVYMSTHAEANITVVGGGSGVGIAALQDATTDIAMSSRDLKLNEKLKLQESGKEFIESIIAYDALSVIVHPDNKVEQLTREQIEGIFTGAITNWKEVGGADEKIIAYSRESSSGTYEFFKEHVLDKKNYATGILMMPATGAMVQSVSQTKGAIGYIGFAYMNENVKALKISYDEGKTFVAPSVENAMNKSYPISRPLIYIYNKETQANAQEFVDFIFSTEGQDIVKKVGYIPVK